MRGATVPFVARYRKEATGGLDDTQLRSLANRLAYLRELEARRATILASIREQEKLTPELEASIAVATSKAALEDLYLPYKPKRRTRAAIARETGLGALAEAILAHRRTPPETLAAPYVTDEVPDTKEALAGARDILTESLAEDAAMLGLWVAGRRNLPEGSAIRGSDPLPLAGVISLAGVNDLEGALEFGNRTDVFDHIGTGAGARLATTSPGRLLPLGVPQVLIVGTRDEAWRIETTRSYAAAAAEAGDEVELLVLEGANHADVVDPHGPAPAMTARAVLSLVNPERRLQFSSGR